MKSRESEITHDVRLVPAPVPGWATGWWKQFGFLCLILAATAIASPAQDEQPSTITFTSLLSFDSTDGATPYAGLIQGTDGNLYGTTYGGGANLSGTAFRITPSGKLTTLYNFCSLSCVDGGGPQGGLVQAFNGNYYGTASYEGANGGGGTVFELTSTGRLTTLYSFCSLANCADGAGPTAALLQASDGSLYGTTYAGGAFSPCPSQPVVRCGTVFKMTPNGTFTTLDRFDSTDGANPLFGALIQATNGDFYGTTQYGGANGNCFNGIEEETCGTIFKVTATGALTTLYSFCSQSNCTDGYDLYGGLVQATDGNFYGTTVNGGANYFGTVFKITPGGTLTTLYSFCAVSGCADGGNPTAGLVQATDGNFYGTTFVGGTGSSGTIFKITPSGTLTTLHSFSGTDGAQPSAELVQDTNGRLYGTTYYGGASGNGTVFSLSLGLSPFVETQTSSGKVGEPVKILGTDLTGATSVSFNGTPAAFIVKASSVIEATVPVGATTGFVTVTTPSATLKSNVKFRVRP